MLWSLFLAAVRASEKEKRQKERYDEGREVDEDDEEVGRLSGRYPQNVRLSSSKEELLQDSGTTK
jgi:hypothetical protein